MWSFIVCRLIQNWNCWICGCRGILPTVPLIPAKEVFAGQTSKSRFSGTTLCPWNTCDCQRWRNPRWRICEDAFSEIFGIEIKNCNVYGHEASPNMTAITYFHDELREKLNKRMVESDLKAENSSIITFKWQSIRLPKTRREAWFF